MVFIYKKFWNSVGQGNIKIIPDKDKKVIFFYYLQ